MSNRKRTRQCQRGHAASVVPGLRAALALCLALLVVTVAGPVSAATADVVWTTEKRQAPTYLPPAGQGMIWIDVANIGDSDAAAIPTLVVDLPDGVTLDAAGLGTAWNCSPLGASEITCTNLAAAFYPTVAGTYAALNTSAVATLMLQVDIAGGTEPGEYPVEVTVNQGQPDEATFSHAVRVSPEQVGFGPREGTFTAGAFAENGDDFTQAGGHPHTASTYFELNTAFTSFEDSDADRATLLAEGNLADVVAELPPGFIGNPTAAATCAHTGLVEQVACPAASQVGVATVNPPAGSLGRARMYGVYNVDPAGNHPAEFAFRSPAGILQLIPTLRSDGDWGISVRARGITQIDSIYETGVTLWGVPADPAHDNQRCGQPNFVTKTCDGHDEAGKDFAIAGQSEALGDPQTSNEPLRPFLTNPTECDGQPERINLHLASWEDRADFNRYGDPDLTDPDWHSVQTTAPAVTGCESLGFSPTVSAQPSTRDAASPAGLDFELGIPQNQDPDGLATAHLEDTTVVLPEGMVVNPSSANGLEGCSASRIGLVSTPGAGDPRFNKEDPFDGRGADCPNASKIGTVEVETPLLEDPLAGEVFLAAQGDHPFDSLVAIYLVIRGPGLIVKLAGEVDLHGTSGRVTTTVRDNPQVPFDRLTLKLKTGDRAPLSVPSVCGDKATSVEMTSRAGHEVSVIDSFDVTGACADDRASRDFDPEVQGGSSSAFAGDYTPFNLRIGRSDTDQELDRITLVTPEGLSAKLAGVPYCPEGGIARAIGRDQAGDGAAEKADPSCPSASKVGATQVAAGVGDRPYYAGGDIYLAGQYKGAPLSLVFIVPAVAGPFDLGVQVVRTALQVNDRTAQITAVSDQIPKVLEGIRLQIQEIRVLMNRDRFTVNPTSCRQMQVSGKIHGTHGKTADVEVPYRVGGCGDLGFAPRFGMRILNGGRKSTLRSFNPRMRFVVRPQAGDANMGPTRVTLPPGVILDQNNIRTTCTRAQFAARNCPEAAIYGYAKAWSPLLDRPVQGPVYMASNGGARLLPDIVADLDGQVRMVLVGEVDSAKGGRLRNTFRVVPDVPVTRFQLTMRGGSRTGILVNSTDLCKDRRRGVVAFYGQNGKRHLTRPRIGMRFKRCKQVRRKVARRQAAQSRARHAAISGPLRSWSSRN